MSQQQTDATGQQTHRQTEALWHRGTNNKQKDTPTDTQSDAKMTSRKDAYRQDRNTFKLAGAHRRRDADTDGQNRKDIRQADKQMD